MHWYSPVFDSMLMLTVLTTPPFPQAPEEESYELLKHMLFALELRKQFMPDMSPLQIQMYQFSRLVHDHHRY